VSPASQNERRNEKVSKKKDGWKRLVDRLNGDHSTSTDGLMLRKTWEGLMSKQDSGFRSKTRWRIRIGVALASVLVLMTAD